jgi:hypothetical protein
MQFNSIEQNFVAFVFSTDLILTFVVLQISTMKEKAAEWPVHQNKESSVNNDIIPPSV